MRVWWNWKYTIGLKPIASMLAGSSPVTRTNVSLLVYSYAGMSKSWGILPTTRKGDFQSLNKGLIPLCLTMQR